MGLYRGLKLFGLSDILSASAPLEWMFRIASRATPFWTKCPEYIALRLMTSLMNLQLHAIDITNLERRLAKLEERLAEKDKLNGHDGAPGSDFSQLRKPSRKV